MQIHLHQHQALEMMTNVGRQKFLNHCHFGLFLEPKPGRREPQTVTCRKPEIVNYEEGTLESDWASAMECVSLWRFVLRR